VLSFSPSQQPAVAIVIAVIVIVTIVCLSVAELMSPLRWLQYSVAVGLATHRTRYFWNIVCVCTFRVTLCANLLVKCSSSTNVYNSAHIITVMAVSVIIVRVPVPQVFQQGKSYPSVCYATGEA
jgi:hypothetical protein